MAILGMFETAVLVNGRALIEYDLDDDEPQEHNTTTLEPDAVVKKYIEAREDDCFSIKFSIKEGYLLPDNATDILCEVILDGKSVCGRFVPRQPERMFSSGIDILVDCTFGRDQQGCYQQKFVFQKLNICKRAIRTQNLMLSESHRSRGYGCSDRAIEKRSHRNMYLAFHLTP
jgi:hypothetical protein